MWFVFLSAIYTEAAAQHPIAILWKQRWQQTCASCHLGITRQSDEMWPPLHDISGGKCWKEKKSQEAPWIFRLSPSLIPMWISENQSQKGFKEFLKRSIESSAGSPPMLLLADHVPLLDMHDFLLSLSCSKARVASSGVASLRTRACHYQRWQADHKKRRACQQAGGGQNGKPIGTLVRHKLASGLPADTSDKQDDLPSSPLAKILSKVRLQLSLILFLLLFLLSCFLSSFLAFFAMPVSLPAPDAVGCG